MQILWKFNFKKKQNTQFLTLLSHNLRQIQSKILNYVKVSSFFFKIVLFFARSTNVGTRRRLHHLQPKVLFPATRRAQRVNNMPVKIFNFFFWSISCGNENQLLEKYNFLLLAKSNSLTWSIHNRNTLKNLQYKKTKGTNICLSKTKRNLW